MTKYPKLLAWAQLVRLPNVFTAFADIFMAGCVTGLIVSRPDLLGWLLVASCFLYWAGMVWNDWFDRHEDAQARPFRPIPSGRVSPRGALFRGVLYLLLGWVVALGASKILGGIDTLGWSSPAVVALALAGHIVFYDGVLKRTPFGPLGMGGCRFLNVMLGLSGTGSDIWTATNLHVAGVVGVYIVGVTWFARTEEGTSSRRQLVLAALVMLAAAAGALAVPVHAHPRDLQWVTPFYFPYLVAGLLFYVGIPVARAIRRPEPKLVQTAVKRSIFGLVALDAILAVAFVGWPGLLILLLLLPATWLGKWVYST